MNRFQTSRHKRRVMRLLLRKRIPHREISCDTGLGYEWLNRLKRGEIVDPGTNRLEVLEDYLKTKRARK